VTGARPWNPCAPVPASTARVPKTEPRGTRSPFPLAASLWVGVAGACEQGRSTEGLLVFSAAEERPDRLFAAARHPAALEWPVEPQGQQRDDQAADRRPSRGARPAIGQAAEEEEDDASDVPAALPGEVMRA